MAISNSSQGVRHCPSCKTEKDVNEFIIRSTGKRKGYPASYCKKCNAVKTAEYRKNNREKYLESKRTHWQKKQSTTSAQFLTHHWDHLDIETQTENQCGIYCITINERFYIGSCISFDKRMKDHTRKLRYGKHINKKMQAAFNKYQMFEVEIIEFCRPEELLKTEQKYISQWFDDPRCMNLKAIATTNVGIKHTEKSKQLLSDALKKYHELRK